MEHAVANQNHAANKTCVTDRTLVLIPAANQDILSIAACNCNSVEIAKEIGFALTCPESLLERP
jgi:hypothetical protein